MSDASAIEPATVSLVLSYLSPPNAPLPPHLASRPLLRRHHFLALSIDSPEEYLAWPSPGSQAAITLLLEQFHHPDDLELGVRYTADAEAVQAHVCPASIATGPSSFRLIFLWDPTDGWQYHNIDLMPFPRNSYPAIADAYGALRSPTDFLLEPGYTVTVATAEDDDNAYWNSYGREVDDSNDPAKGSLKPHPDSNSEDAYWARYSSIQGSADSTIPSPLPVKRDADGAQSHGEERVYIVSSSLQPNNPDEEPYNPLEPPSPDALSRRLASLPVRPESPPFEEENSSEGSDLAASLDQMHHDPIALRESLPAINLVEDPATRGEKEESEVALQQSIQGLYRLWSVEQTRKFQVPNQEAFLALVRQAIEEQ